MSKKRGLSLDEKRGQLLQIFYESHGFYLLRELEKLGPKKGVVSQTVKDVLQSLVDDDLVFKDKIGTSVYFWSLPSCSGNQLRRVRAKLETELECSKQRKIQLEIQRELSKKGREDTTERDLALADLKRVEEQHRALKDELTAYADNDPAIFEAMRSAVQVAHASVNRWTGMWPWLMLGHSLVAPIVSDNIFAMQHWCSKSFPEAKDNLELVYKEVGITEDLDYVD